MGDVVYVIEGGGAVKIGLSRDPRSRLAQLQTGSPHALSLAYTLPVEGDAYAVEAEAHAMLDRHRIGGEWFAVPADVAVAAVSGAAYRLGSGTPADTRFGSSRLSWPVRWTLAVLLPLVFWTVALGPAPTLGCAFLIVSCLALLWRARAVPETRPRPLGTRAFFVLVMPALFIATAWPGGIVAGWFGYHGTP